MCCSQIGGFGPLFYLYASKAASKGVRIPIGITTYPKIGNSGPGKMK